MCNQHPLPRADVVPFFFGLPPAASFAGSTAPTSLLALFFLLIGEGLF